MINKRIVVTGMGILSPIGNTLAEFKENIFNGVIGTGKISSFDMSKYSLNNGGEVKGFEAYRYFDKLDPAHFDRSSQFAVAGTKMALENANLNLKSINPKDIGVVLGTTLGNMQTLEEKNNRLAQNQDDRLEKYKFYPANTLSSTVASEFGFMGPNMVIPTACAAGNYAIGYSASLINDGKAEYMICGGTDALSRACYTMFYKLRAISSDKCKPFDEERNGMIVSEGCGILLLESLESALKRGAKIYAEIGGSGHSCDAYHPTAPHPEGKGAAIAIKKALKNSNLEAGDIDYISAHGTGTQANDNHEAKAVNKVFKDFTPNILISSIKSMLGHTMGAASAIEAIASILAINSSTVPPNANLSKLDKSFNLNVSSEKNLKADIKNVISNSFAFGGNISTLVLKKYV
jgi:3-oxoacyl-[acyl-carrier-protein] synthase II